MKALKRLAAALPLAVLLSAGTPAGAQGWGDDNWAVVGNDRDATSAGRSKVEIRFDDDGVVDNRNVAVAIADCVDCQTLAIAMQAVVVTAPPSRVEPRNEATAVNVSCESCLTAAFATQIVVQVDGPATLTPEGEDRLGRLRASLHHLTRDFGSMTPGELASHASAAEQELVSILTTELVADPEAHVVDRAAAEDADA